MSNVLPNVPTMQEAGVNGYEFSFWYGAWVRVGTPLPVVEKLREAMLHAFDEPEGRRFMEANACKPMRMTRSEFEKFQLDELDKWAKVVKTAGIVPQ